MQEYGEWVNPVLIKTYGGERPMSDLEKRVAQLEQMVLQMARTNVPIVSKLDDTSNKVEQITPYTDTKTAYYGDTSVTFYDAPQGRASVFIDDMPMDYSVSRIEGRLVVSFDQLEVASVQITISIQ